MNLYDMVSWLRLSLCAGHILIGILWALEIVYYARHHLRYIKPAMKLIQNQREQKKIESYRAASFKRFRTAGVWILVNLLIAYWHWDAVK
jgi:hypothetical protein